MTSNDSDAVRNGWAREMRLDGAKPCPICRHVPQLRQHVFTTTMALALIHLYHRGTAEEGSIPDVVKTGESLKKLELWGLVERQAGMCRLTESGVEAALKRRTVPRHCVAAHGQALWFTGELVWIDETLNQRYSYEDLMKGAA